jgi:uncharacterized protein YhdP
LYANDVLKLQASFDKEYHVMAHREKRKWYIEVDSTDLSGNARLMQELKSDQPVELNLDYINIAILKQHRKQAKSIDLSPSDFPPLRIQIVKLDWEDYQLEDINIETAFTEHGMLIKHFEVHAPTVNIMGTGSWFRNWRQEDTTTLDFTMDTHDLGQTLNQFKITDSIKGTDGRASGHWSWPAKPYDFDWNILKGHATLDLEEGRLADIDVGAGRLIGILNFETLLSLDFGDQVSEGFAFDSFKGDVRFNAGNAYTRNLTLESKVAEITLDGRIGLSDEDYDQTITVIPGVGSTLTLIGAVAGGPTTAAIVHLFRKLFGIDRIAAYKYSVTGSWTDPQVELLEMPENKETNSIGYDEELF